MYIIITLALTYVEKKYQCVYKQYENKSKEASLLLSVPINFRSSPFTKTIWPLLRYVKGITKN